MNIDTITPEDTSVKAMKNEDKDDITWSWVLSILIGIFAFVGFMTTVYATWLSINWLYGA